MKFAKRMFYQSFNNIGGSTNMYLFRTLYAGSKHTFLFSVCCKFSTLFRTLQTESKSTFSVSVLVCCNSVPIPCLIRGIKNVPFQYVINSVLIYGIKKHVTNSVPYMRNQNIPFQYVANSVPYRRNQKVPFSISISMLQISY